VPVVGAFVRLCGTKFARASVSIYWNKDVLNKSCREKLHVFSTEGVFISVLQFSIQLTETGRASEQTFLHHAPIS
jgi:hypothetical protein